MSKLYFEIFDQPRKEAFKKLKEFKDAGVLGGGTAIAFLLGHRFSYDFDIFSPKKVKRNLLKKAILHQPVRTKSISLFDLNDLASNKAYVIGRRGEYRDYVDMFFMIKHGLKLKKIIKEAEKRFKGAFSERLFLEQLLYFGDLKNFQIDFLAKKYSPDQIKKFFQKVVKHY